MHVQFSTDTQPVAQNGNNEEHGGNNNSNYTGSQQSESECSDKCGMVEREDDSTKLSRASSEEQPEASGKNRPTLSLSISLSENLEGKLHVFGQCTSIFL